MQQTHGTDSISGVTNTGDNTDNHIALLDVFKPKWYIEQMKGWSRASYLLLSFGIAFILGSTLAQPLTIIGLWTLVAAILGFTTTVSITNTRPLNGIFGMVSALIYCVVAFNAHNYNDIVLQGTYILLLDLPILLIPSWAHNVDKKVRGLLDDHGVRNILLTVLFFAVVLAALYFWESGYTDSPRPLVDASAATIGITGAMLTTLRFKESYFAWILQGIFSVLLWGITASQGDASPVLFFTYILYLANDGVALFDKNIAWFHKKS